MRCECGHNVLEHWSDGTTFCIKGKCLAKYCRCNKFKKFEEKTLKSQIKNNGGED